MRNAVANATKKYEALIYHTTLEGNAKTLGE